MTALTIVTALVAGSLAALLRYAVSVRFAAAAFPWAVLVVNLTGSVVAGAAIAIGDAIGVGELRYVLLGGVAGGLTTFSTFGVETVQLAMDGRRRDVIVSVAANLFGGLLAVVVGWVAVAVLIRAFG